MGLAGLPSRMAEPAEILSPFMACDSYAVRKVPVSRQNDLAVLADAI